jgi:lysophospholipase L1-like esterase
MIKKLICFLLVLHLCNVCKAVTKVACIGASITYGATVKNREQNSYPAQLQTMLGNKYQVNNYGVSSCTMLKHGDHSYWNTKEYQAALASKPNIVFIDLGGNDAKLVNRVYLNEYTADCKAMAAAFAALPTHPRVILLLPVVSFDKDTTGIWDPVIVNQVMPKMRQAAYDDKLEVIDIHSLLINHPELMPDKIHPDSAGSGIIARRLQDQLIAKRDTGFNIFKAIDQQKSEGQFYGYACADFMLNGHQCKVVKPKWSAPHHPWVWRARFWGHEPQTDIALLERGFHIVYCDVAELFGNAEAIAQWNQFYNELHHGGLAPKAVMEGMSRGAVYALNWAAVNPNKVACVYIDNPLLDMKSWPAGLGKVVPASPDEFKQFKDDYHLETEEQVRNFKGSPIDKIAQIVKGHYPILILCADADEAAIPAENTLPFEKQAKELGGNITVIHKPGFKHHPHSLPKPTPIVEFILNSVQL